MFLILLPIMIALILIAVTVIAVSVGGVFILIFSDVIVCIGFIIWLIVKLINKRRG